VTPTVVPRASTALRRTRFWLPVLLGLAALAGCGGGGGNPAGAGPTPTGPAALNNLTANEVSTILAQAVGEAQAHHVAATLAVVDRVGNVLGVYQMNGAALTFTITDGRAVSGGLENVHVLPSSFAAIAEAVTGAYLSSDGNAFTSRTASQIIQENFNPGELGQAGGPLFGVQFSQLPCSDLIAPMSGTIGPHASPLGLAGSPGGLPLYKGSVLVGGIGAIADSRYTIDRNILDLSASLNELIAVAGASGFDAPQGIRANRITANGRSLRYVNSEAILSHPASHAALGALPGALLAVGGFSTAALRDGVAYGTPASGIRADTGVFSAYGAFALVDGTNNVRYPLRAGTDGLLTLPEVRQVLLSALQVGSHARAQIRQPLNSAAQISIVVVDTTGAILGFTRSADAPIFGIDVALQKARTANFFSQGSAAAQLAGAPAANYISPPATSSIGAYVTRTAAFVGNPNAFADGTAYSVRAIGDLARPFFPDGINGNGPGPLSLPFSSWSVFADGIQLDLDYNAIVAAATGAPTNGCTALPELRNGIQIFPGGVPIYRGIQLVGAIGVSGDGVNQDDMVAFLGLANAGRLLRTGIANAPSAIRADKISPPGTGTSLLYVQCPQAPFVDNSEQDVCSGI
jgi:uncharacterized protein GlcG (DUF336 family)